ncbi:helix-turn-helix transcriptional regulator [bacterium]|nr:helix-turn-helix transcriptional regulator [bacterium]
MDEALKLRKLSKETGFTQEKLAQALKVSFVTLNSWINERSVPRKKAKEKIEALYRHHFGC